MSSRASMTSRWPARASDRASRIPLIGGQTLGVLAPAGTWPNYETSSCRSQTSAAALPSDPMCSISRDPRRDEYTTLRGHRAQHRFHCPHIWQQATILRPALYSSANALGCLMSARASRGRIAGSSAVRMCRPAWIWIVPFRPWRGPSTRWT